MVTFNVTKYCGFWVQYNKLSTKESGFSVKNLDLKKKKGVSSRWDQKANTQKQKKT